MEAYVNGVSTRKVDRLVEQLGVHGMSKDRVSAICRALDERVRGFRERPLEGEFPYLWLDAKQVMVRSGGHVRSKAVVIAYGVHESGRREVLDLDVGEVEAGAFWVEFLRSLRARGLAGVRLRASDAHEGLKAAIARVLGCPWQRCTVHFVRDMHHHCRPSERGMVFAALREIFNAESYEAARERVSVVLERLRGPVPKVAELLEGAEEDLLGFYRFPAPHWPKLRSTDENVKCSAGSEGRFSAVWSVGLVLAGPQIASCGVVSGAVPRFGAIRAGDGFADGAAVCRGGLSGR